MGWSRPWLQRFHRNFAIIYVITTIHFLWNAVNGIFGDPSWYDLPLLQYVNRADPELWGLAYLITGIVMLVGLFRSNFTIPLGSAWLLGSSLSPLGRY